MSVALTSKESYSKHVSSGNKLRQRQAIMNEVYADNNEPMYRYEGSLTRRELSQLTGLDRGDIAGRVNKLIKDGLLVDKGTVKCSKTGKTVGLVGLPEKQGELYD